MDTKGVLNQRICGVDSVLVYTVDKDTGIALLDVVTVFSPSRVLATKY